MVQFSRIIAGAALALALGASAVSAAPMVCAPREVITKVLERRLQTKVEGVGLVDSGTGMVELYVGPAPKRMWSVVITDANMLSCIILAGDGWQVSDEPEEGA